MQRGNICFNTERKLQQQYREGIFGHIHNARNRAFEVMIEEPRSLNAGCMINGYMPVTFEELLVNNGLFRK